MTRSDAFLVRLLRASTKQVLLVDLTELLGPKAILVLYSGQRLFCRQQGFSLSYHDIFWIDHSSNAPCQILDRFRYLASLNL